MFRNKLAICRCGGRGKPLHRPNLLDVSSDRCQIFLRLLRICHPCPQSRALCDTLSRPLPANPVSPSVSTLLRLCLPTCSTLSLFLFDHGCQSTRIVAPSSDR